jgi:hypothetical protein
MFSCLFPRLDLEANKLFLYRLLRFFPDALSHIRAEIQCNECARKASIKVYLCFSLESYPT